MVSFNEAMLSNDRTLAIKVGDFTSENIKSANFKYGYITGDDFTPGGTYAGMASILFASVVESFKKLDVVYPEIGLLVGSKVEWVKMGKYYIDDIKIDRNANTTEIELMDEMFKLNESFKTDLKYPAQIRDVILEIATKTGVTLASDDFGITAIQQHVDEPTGDKLTYRDVLSQASQLLGFSCFFNRNGELEVRGLTESGITITADNYFLHGLEKSEVEYQIAGITCEIKDDEVLTVGLQTGRSLEIENPLATQDTLNALYYVLKDITYYPYDLSYQGHLKLDVGQWVTIKTNKDEVFKVPVLYQSFSFSGGLTSTISADSVAGSDAQYTYGSFVTKKIEQKSTRIQAEVQQQLKYADEEFKKVSNEMLQQSLEYQNSVRNELATSKAEIETQIDTAKTQAESNAKAYADEINQTTLEVAEQANTAANSLKSDLAKVKTDLTTVTNTANSAKTSASEAKQQLTTVANDLSKAKQDLTSQASQLQAQASAQTELTKRVSTVEETANGTKSTVSELNKTVAQNGKDITSVTARTKVVEDDLTSTKTTLSQVQTTANSASSKAATLETGLNGLSAKFENLSVGNKNYLPTSRVINRGCTNFSYSETSKSWTMTVPASSTGFGNGITFNTSGLNILLNGGETLFFGLMIKASKACSFNYDINNYLSGTTSNDNDDRSKQAWSPSNKSIPANVWTRVWFSYTAKANVPIAEANSNFGIVNNTEAITVEIKEVMVAKSNVPVDYQTPDADVEQKIAEYKQNADQNYASLQTTVKNLDGTVKQNKSEFDQTASQIKSSISAVEDKIPTNLDSLNLMTGTRDWSTKTNAWHMGINWSTESEEYQGLKVHSTQKGYNGSHQNIFVKNGDVVTFSFFAKATNTLSKIKVSSRWSGSSVYQAPLAGVKESDEQITITSEWKRYSKTVHITSDGSLQFRTEYEGSTIPDGNTFYVAGLKVAKSALDTGYSENPTDVASDITKMNTTLTQTANGLEQLSTQVTSQGNTITSHTNSINSLTTGLSAKVSQTDFNTLSGRVTTAENNITAKANELSSKISSVEGQIPTNVSTRNLILKSNDLANPHKQSGANTTVTSTEDYFVIKSTGYTANAWGGMSWNMSISEVTAGEEFSILMAVYIDSSVDLDNGWNFNLKNHPSNSTAYNYSIPVTKKDEWFNVAITFKTTKDVVFDTYPFYVYLVKNGLVRIKPPMLVRGSLIPNDWQLAPEDYDSKLATAKSEIKQTTDSIKASVSALDSSTVKTASLTINTDGVVMKAGKSTTDIANAIGSYFGVNQNAINLFSDKINVKANMIVDGAITSTKIASKSINTAHLNGKIITADVIATNAITADAIKAGAITTNKMTANSINGDRITAGTLDAAKIKAGSITASQIASGTITSSQIKAGGISAANIATGAITTNHLATGSITADKIKAGSITADMFEGNKITSLNNATTLNLQTGEITFNNIYATINQTKGNYKSQISLFSLSDEASTENSWSSTNVLAFNSTKLTSATRYTGLTTDMFPNFSRTTLYGERIAFTGEAPVSPGPKNSIIITTNSDGVNFTNNMTSNSKGHWKYSMIMDFGTEAAINVPDIKLDGHFKSLTGILDDLCKKVGVLWI